MADEPKEYDSSSWAPPSNPSKFSGWNAGLSPFFAFAAIVGALAVAEPEAAKGVIKGAIQVFTGEAFKNSEQSKPQP